MINDMRMCCASTYLTRSLLHHEVLMFSEGPEAGSAYLWEERARVGHRMCRCSCSCGRSCLAGNAGRHDDSCVAV